MKFFRVLIVIIICTVLVELHGQHQWQRMPCPVEDDLYDVYFENDTLGWACSYMSSAVIHTHDGGHTWKVQARFDSLFFVRIHFIDASCGWLCGNRGAIYKTIDGGKNWISTVPDFLKRTVQSNSPWGVVFYNMHFFSPDEGFVMGVMMNPMRNIREYFILKTKNGGENWIPETQVPKEILYHTVFVDENVGYTTGTGTIYKTQDRGTTWFAVYEGAQDQFRGLFFLNRETGWVCGFSGHVLKTTDGGYSWEKIRVTSNRLRSIGFVDENYGFTVGDCNSENSVLYQTYDGGANWHGTEEDWPDLFRIHFSPNAVWIVGKKGMILRGNRAVNLYEKEPLIIHVFTPEGKSLPGEFRLNDGRQVLLNQNEWEDR